MSMKVLEVECLSPYRGCVTRTWKEGSYTEDHVRRNGRRWKWSISFIGLHMVKLRHLARDGLTNRFIGLDYSPLAGYNPGFDTGLLTVHNTL
jgi:hypothetical protein